MKLELQSLLQLGEPVEHRGIAVVPLFPRTQPRAEYVTLDEALPLGFRVTEVDEAGVVPELLVENPLDLPVLLYDGEELVGAKQDRILNVTVLVAAASATKIPVSCVEHGRWSRQTEHFAAAPHAAYPELRRRKAEQQLAAPSARGIAQSVVWDAVADKAARLSVRSATDAHSDIFASRERELAALRDAFPPQAGQAGAILLLGAKPVCLDYASRPDAFARLYPKLLDGYLLDALEHLDEKAAGRDGAAAFVADVDEARRARTPSVGLGEDVRLHGRALVGGGVELDGELIQLSAFTNGYGAQRTPARVARPARRRP